MGRLRLELVDYIYGKKLEDYRDGFLRNKEVLHGGGGIENFKKIDDWIKYNIGNRNIETVSEGFEPSSTYLLMKDDEMVGIIDIRHSLNDFLFREGGHIGYSIGKDFRLRGYGKEMLKLGLEKAKELGIDRVLVTCNQSNVGSKKVIISCGGSLENTVGEDGNITERYWIDN